MPNYMVQSMTHGLTKEKYYRKQTSDHVSHDESSKFTTDAKDKFATDNAIANTDEIEVGKYQSGQGVPNDGTLI